MNKGKILKAIGSVLAVVGLLFIVYAVLPADESFTAELPGGDYYYMMSVGNLISGSVDFEFTVADGSVVVYVFSADEFSDYEQTGVGDPLYTTSGDSGAFTFEMPDSGTYYFVFEHSTLSWAVSQDIQVSATINGVAILGLALGVVLVAVGVLVLLYGTRVLKQEAAAAPPTPPAPGNVILFQNDQQRPPTQP